MEEQQLTKRQRRLLKRESREKDALLRTKKRKVKRVISWAVFFAIIAGLVWLFATDSGGNGSTNSIATGNFSEGDPVIGAENALVTIEEYSDFQCPACRAAEPLVKSLLAQFPNEVQLVYNDFPLTQIHPHATAAAEAAQCAYDQDAFWEYHDLLFDRQDEWASERNPDDLFFSYAEELELDSIVFSSCTNERDHRRTVQDDVTEGNVRGVSATPTFYVNGNQISTNDLIATVENLVQTLRGESPEEPLIEVESSENVSVEVGEDTQVTQ